jgi:DNA polymerase III alpha subunit (gram-positive type)
MLAGHNIIDFDIPFYSVVNSWFNINWLAELNPQPFDTLNMGRMIWPQTTKDTPDAKVTDHQLATCCSAVGVKLTDAHRASADTEANAQMILRWFEMMRGGAVKVDNVEKIENKSAPYQF